MSAAVMGQQMSAVDRPDTQSVSERPRPTLSIVLIPSSSAGQMTQAVHVCGPMAIAMDADFVVVLLNDASQDLRQMVEMAGGRVVFVGESSSRSEICDAAMATIRSDIVLFREAEKVGDGVVPVAPLLRAARRPLAGIDRPVAIKVERLSDLPAETKRSAGDRCTHAVAVPGGSRDLHREDMAQMAVAG